MVATENKMDALKDEYSMLCNKNVVSFSCKKYVFSQKKATVSKSLNILSVDVEMQPRGFSLSS
jgi:hypothetical protein